ncbi:MAG: ABC transporter substrate-binding protein [Promethearchaeota archaeon]|jgi:peptide/nickel transport system substrate-binding protein
MSEEKKVLKKKKRTLKTIITEHKTIVVGGLIAVVAIAGIVGGIFLFWQVDRGGGTFVFASNNVVNSLDPHRTRGGLQNQFLWDQVAEGLFDYNHSSPEYEIISCLATEWEWSEDQLNFTCILREGVRFHDRTPFNATAVKWNFDRIQRLLYEMNWPYLWLNSWGENKINRTIVLDNYIVRFILNEPYSALPALLASGISYILSPTSTPVNEFININSTVFGTGPYIMDKCETYYKGVYQGLCINVTLIPNPHYWGKKPSFDKVIITNGPWLSRIEGMESGDIHFVVPDRYDEREAYKNMTDVEIVEKVSLEVLWLHMNNDLFPKEMRKAISYAFNYTYWLESRPSYDRWEREYIRAKSPISKGLIYSNWEDFDVPDYNIQIARQALLDANWSGTENLTASGDISPGNPWEELVTGGTPLATYNFTYIYDSWFLGNLTLEISKNLKQIGVEINPLGVTSGEMWNKIFTGDYDFIQDGWGPSFNDPADMINPLYSSKGDGFFNFINFNNTVIQQWMEQALESSDSSTRQSLYYQIQEHLIQDYASIWLGSPIEFQAWSSNVEGLQHESSLFKTLLKNGYFA